MAPGGAGGTGPFRRDVARYRRVGKQAGLDKPPALTRAEALVSLCRLFGQPPSVVLAEDAHEQLSTLDLLSEG